MGIHFKIVQGANGIITPALCQEDKNLSSREYFTGRSAVTLSDPGRLARKRSGCSRMEFPLRNLGDRER